MQGQKFPVPHIVRGANNKNVRDIQEEIRTAQAQPMSGREVKVLPWVTLLPTFARQIFLWFMFKNPRLIKEFLGTVGLTAVGLFADRGGWGGGFPRLPTPGVLGGGVVQRPGGRG